MLIGRYTEGNSGYSAVHVRLRKTPVDGPCAICGAIATEWAYDHADPNELIGVTGARNVKVAYSVNILHYFPVCIPCHRRFDKESQRWQRSQLRRGTSSGT